MLSRYFLNNSVMVPDAPVVTEITFFVTLNMRVISFTLLLLLLLLIGTCVNNLCGFVTLLSLEGHSSIGILCFIFIWHR